MLFIFPRIPSHDLWQCELCCKCFFTVQLSRERHRHLPHRFRPQYSQSGGHFWVQGVVSLNLFFACLTEVEKDGQALFVSRHSVCLLREYSHSFQSRKPLTSKFLMSCPIQKTLCFTTESLHFFANTTPYHALQIIIPVRRHLAIARSHGRNVTCFLKIEQAGAWDPMMPKQGCVQNVE